MKRPLFYSLRCTVYGGPRVVSVTTYKRSRWYGRYTDYEESTNGVRSDLSGRFETAGAAYAAVNGVKKIREFHEPLIEMARRNLAQKHVAAMKEEQAFLKKLPGFIEGDT